MGDSKVKVAVRIRPMNRREIDLHTKCVVDVDANKVILNPVNTNLSKGDARKGTDSRSTRWDEDAPAERAHRRLPDPQLIDKLMQDLESSKDNEVDFNEFVVKVGSLTVACNDYFVEQSKKKGK